MRNLNAPGEVANLLAEVDAALAALQPKNYEDATWFVNQGLREKFLAELRHPLNNESAIAIAGGQIGAKFDAFIAGFDKNVGWSSHVRGPNEQDRRRGDDCRRRFGHGRRRG